MHSNFETSDAYFFAATMNSHEIVGFFDDIDVCLAHISRHHAENYMGHEGSCLELTEDDLNFLGYEEVIRAPGCTSAFTVDLASESYHIAVVGKKPSSHPGACRSVTHDRGC